MISVIIPVLDEEAQIGRCLDRLQPLLDRIEVVVCDGGSSDGTAREVKARPWARLATSPRPGRGLQMNVGAETAAGSVLLFLHADTELPADAPERLEEALADPRVCGGGFRKRHHDAPPLLALMDWGLNEVRAGLFGDLVGTNALFVRAGLFRQLGGYRDWPLLEDVEFSDRLKAAGRTVLLAACVTVSPRKYLKEGTFQRILVNARVMAGYRLLGQPPDRLASIYRRPVPRPAPTDLLTEDASLSSGLEPRASSLGAGEAGAARSPVWLRRPEPPAESGTRMRGGSGVPARVALAVVIFLMSIRTTPFLDRELEFDLASGELAGLRLEQGSLALAGPANSGSWTSPSLPCDPPWRQAVPSWNASTPAGASLRIEVRAMRAGRWSRWFTLADWQGTPTANPLPCKAPAEEERDDVAGVKLDADTLVAEAPGAGALQARVTLTGAAGGPGPALRRFGAVTTAFTDRQLSDLPALAGVREDAGFAPTKELEVGFRSQGWEDPAIRSRICCPTSLSMVMAYHGVSRPTREVALRCYDAAHDLFGNWANAAAAAAEYGFAARVTRLRSWEAARPLLARGLPLIISVSFGAGELDGSPMRNGTAGHLLVVRGLRADGRVAVCDPAGRTEETGRLAYPAEQLLAAWKNGAAIVVEPAGQASADGVR